MTWRFRRDACQLFHEVSVLKYYKCVRAFVIPHGRQCHAPGREPKYGFSHRLSIQLVAARRFYEKGLRVGGGRTPSFRMRLSRRWAEASNAAQMPLALYRVGRKSSGVSMSRRTPGSSTSISSIRSACCWSSARAPASPRSACSCGRKRAARPTGWPRSPR